MHTVIRRSPRFVLLNLLLGIVALLLQHGLRQHCGRSLHGERAHRRDFPERFERAGRRDHVVLVVRRRFEQNENIAIENSSVRSHLPSPFDADEQQIRRLR